MQSAEEHLGALIVAYEDANREDRALCEPSVRIKVNQGALAAADLIRERDAEVRADERAKVLAGFTEVHTLAWDGEPSMSGAPHRCSTAAELDLATARQVLDTVGRRKPNPRIERRLVGPWEPTP